MSLCDTIITYQICSIIYYACVCYIVSVTRIYSLRGQRKSYIFQTGACKTVSDKRNRITNIINSKNQQEKKNNRVNRNENNNNMYNVARRDRGDYIETGNVCRLFGTAIGSTVRGRRTVLGCGGGVSLQVGGAYRGPGGQWTDTPTFGVRRRRVSPPTDRE